jgi:hypothetical protein
MMSVATESFGASAVKVAAVAAGAAMSGMSSVASAIGGNAQLAIWCVTIIYGVLQIIKCVPWFLDQSYAFWRVIRYWDWSRMWAIARRSEKSDDGSSKQ